MYNEPATAAPVVEVLRSLDLCKEFPSGGLYGNLGFKLMKRPISFTDVRKTFYDAGEMFVTVESREIYDLVMSSPSTFHTRRGYW
jgi:hypothetical protein